MRLAAGSLAVASGEYPFQEAAPPRPRQWPPGQLAVWLSHFPVADVRTALADAGLPHPGDIVNRPAVAAALAACPVPVLVLAGHTHVRVTVAAGRVLQFSFPALIEEPHELSIVDIDARQLTLTRTAYALTTEHAMGRGDLSPVTESWSFRPDLWCSTGDG